MDLRNYMEEPVRETLEEVLKQDSGACDCERCKLDMAAIMLNQLPPKYVVREKGYAYARANELVQQFKVDLTVAAVNAKEKVKQHPRH